MTDTSAATAASTTDAAVQAEVEAVARVVAPGRHLLRALTTFHNGRVTGAAGVEGVVNAGDEFETDTNHAQDLVRGGLAEALDATTLDAAERTAETADNGAIAMNRTTRTTKLKV